MPFSKLDPGSTVREDELLIAQAEIARYPDPYLWHGFGHLDPGSTVREGEYRTILDLDPKSVVREGEFQTALETDKKPTKREGEFGPKSISKLDPGSVVREGEFGLGKLGTEIVGYMPSGRPIISNPDGSYSTERTATVELPNGRWVNIPTIFDGKEVSVDQAFNIMSQYGFKDPETGKKAKEFKSESEASKAATSGSKAKDKVLMEAIKRYKSERRNFPSMFDKSGRRIK